MSATYLALLRGINVGGKNRLPMKALHALFVAAGCDFVQTYIQSGNVVFCAVPEVAAQIARQITTQIAETFSYQIPVIVRTLEQMREVTLFNPYLPTEADETLHVLFLEDLPTSQSIASLEAHRSPPDTFQVRGQEVYLHLPQGVACTKFTNAYFEARLKTRSTQRNWRTVTALLALMADADVAARSD